MECIMKLLEILKSKESFDGEFKVFKYYDNSEYIGHIHLRLKKGWNQLHIEVEEQFQRKGYAVKMIEDLLSQVHYVSIPEGRIVNDNIYKIIKKFESNPKYEVWKTKYNEWIISDKNRSKLDINGIFK